MSNAQLSSPVHVALPFQVSVDTFSGSASIAVDFDLPSGRADMTPSLGLSYGSAQRRGAFGHGWSLTGLPIIGVDADDGLPRYDGSDGYSSSLGGSLVAARQADDRLITRTVGDHRVQRFRAQVDTSRIRFERWLQKPTGNVHWRSRDTANTVTIFGQHADGSSRISDPAATERVYQWLPELQINAFGDAIHFAYDAEDLRGGVGRHLADARRSGPQAQRYLRRISWGNVDPTDVDAFAPETAAWSFQAVFDYGDFDETCPGIEPNREWLVREDPFLVGTPGFEIRTWRLCRRLLLFHKFAELGTEPMLTRTLAFDYDERAEGTRLVGITKTCMRTDEGVRHQKALPPLTFGYTEPAVSESFAEPSRTLAAAAPAGLSTTRTQLVDLYGEGLPGILHDDPAGWFFQRNLGGGDFAPARCVNARPAHSLEAVNLGDFDADGNMDAVVLSGQGAGHYRFDRTQQIWEGFRSFASVPHLGGSDDVQRLDLTGDGRADVVVRDGDAFTIYQAKGSTGYGAVATRSLITELIDDAPTGPPPLNTDPDTAFLFADMSGDGLPDQVMIRSGSVVYWPNLGRGRFGRPVIMENAPILATGDRSSIDRILLADLDGSGTSDLIHLDEGEIRIWTNANGNSFSDFRVLAGLPMIDQRSVLEILDIMGDGTMSLVWNEGRAGGVSSFQTLALTGPEPPGLLDEISNNMGRRERLIYGHSAKHYHRDQASPRAWSTRIPRDEWEWRKNYRVWEANRKVFLWPENYMEPALRDNKTPLFEDLEKTLLQQDINEQTVLDAYAAYLRGFEELASLRIAGAYHEHIWSSKTDILHIFGCTSDDPPVYYYWTIENLTFSKLTSTRRISYSARRKIDVAIGARDVSPIMYNNRLHVFWLERSTAANTEVEDGENKFLGYRHTLKVKYSALRLDGSWTPPQELSLGRSMTMMEGGIRWRGARLHIIS